MGIRHDVEHCLEKYKITKIDGQPKDEDLHLLTKELTNAAGSVATQNGGGEKKIVSASRFARVFLQNTMCVL